MREGELSTCQSKNGIPPLNWTMILYTIYLSFFPVSIKGIIGGKINLLSITLSMYQALFNVHNTFLWDFIMIVIYINKKIKHGLR